MVTVRNLRKKLKEATWKTEQTKRDHDSLLSAKAFLEDWPNQWCNQATNDSNGDGHVDISSLDILVGHELQWVNGLAVKATILSPAAGGPWNLIMKYGKPILYMVGFWFMMSLTMIQQCQRYESVVNTHCGWADSLVTVKKPLTMSASHAYLERARHTVMEMMQTGH